MATFALIHSFLHGIYSSSLSVHVSALAAVTLVFVAAPAFAELPRAAALSATASSPDVEPLAGALDRVLRAELDKLKVVNTAGTPALALSELQLAVGCVGETPSCLAAVAKQLEVEILLLTNLDRAGDETVLTVTKFDAKKEGVVKSGVRRASGPKADAEILGAADGLLRELFELPAAPPRPIAEVDLTPPVEKPIPVPAIVAGGIGAVALISAGVFAGLGSGSESDYAASPTNSQAEIDAAIDHRDRANGQYTTAAVLSAVGGAALIASAVLFFFPSPKTDEAADEPPLAFGSRP